MATITPRLGADVQVVLATDAFAGIGGSETYLLTVAEQLERLGHCPTIYARVVGAMSELAITRGIRVAPDPNDLPGHCDVVLVQDGGMAYELAQRYPTVPQVFVAHSPIFDLQLPPLIRELTSAVVVMSERVEQRIRALDTSHEIARLRQPIDTDRLVPRGAPCGRPERALLLGNYLRADARRVIVDAWTSAGLEVIQFGQPTTETLQPEAEIAKADIVVGKGRAILDAMACGRPAYLYDVFGTDGWVTAERYPAMEADGFAGLALPDVVDGERLRKDLEAYDPLMGQVNRQLILTHHVARIHVHELVALFHRLAPGAPPATTPYRELARLVRLRWRAEAELFGVRIEFGSLAEQLAAVSKELANARAAQTALTARAEHAERALEVARQQHEEFLDGQRKAAAPITDPNH